MAEALIKNSSNILKSSTIDSPIGTIITVADNDGLYLLEFAETSFLEKKIKRLITKTKSAIMPGTNSVIESIQKELESYFAGSLKKFKTSIHMLGTNFQKIVWKELMHIPYGETKSYLDQAKAIGKPQSFRAVANSNSNNNLIIIIPCHRIINSNGKLGGYSSGLHRKEFLLNLEKHGR